MSIGSELPSAPRGDPSFATTRWSVVLAAQDGISPEARASLSWLCESYWYPLYAFLRRSGHNNDAASDRVQAFFAELLSRNAIAAADRTRGRFRDFLLTALRNFCADQRDREAALKRGGGVQTLRLDMSSAEDRYRMEPADPCTPEKEFMRAWALSLLQRAIDELRSSYVAQKKATLFDALKPYLTANAEGETYAEVGARLKLSEAAIKVAVFRMRQRYRAVLQEEIARTLDDPSVPGAVENELRELFAALQR